MADDAAARLYQAFVSQDPAHAITVIEKARAAGVASQAVRPALRAGDGASRRGVGERGDRRVRVHASGGGRRADHELRHHPVGRPGLGYHRSGGRYAPRPSRHRQGHRRRRPQGSGAPGHRPWHRRAPGRVPGACRGDRRAYRDRVRAESVSSATSVSRVREMFRAGGRETSCCWSREARSGPMCASPRRWAPTASSAVRKARSSS